jgi:hypothetical protein
VLAYLSRYTHRVAISSSRLISLNQRGVTDSTVSSLPIRFEAALQVEACGAVRAIDRFVLLPLLTSKPMKGR